MFVGGLVGAGVVIVGFIVGEATGWVGLVDGVVGTGVDKQNSGGSGSLEKTIA